MDRQTTAFAEEQGLRPSVGFGDMTTQVAFATRISGINENNGYTCKSRLIADKSRQFPKSPFTESFSLLFPNCYPDTLEILKGYASKGAFSRLNDIFGNGVVRMLFESSFPGGEFFEMPFGGFGSFLLEHLSEYVYPDPGGVYMGAAERLAIGGRGEIDNAEIDADERFDVFDVIFGDFDGLEQVEFAFLINQVGFAFDVGQILFVVAKEGDFESAIDRPDGYGFAFVRKEAAIVGDAAERTESSLDFLIQPVGVGDLADASDQRLGAKARSLFKAVIDMMVKLEFVEGFIRPGGRRDFVADPIAFFEGIKQALHLFFRGQQLDLQG